MIKLASELLKDLEIRIAKLEKQSKRFNLSDEYAISLHKDLLIWLKNISKRTITYDNYDEFRSRLMSFGGEISSSSGKIKQELEGIERDTRSKNRESKGFSYDEYIDHLHFEKGMYEDDAIEYADFNYIDDKEMDEIFKITTVFKEKINVLYDLDHMILDIPSLPERNVPKSESEIRDLLRMNNRSEYEIDTFFSQNELNVLNKKPHELDLMGLLKRLIFFNRSDIEKKEYSIEFITRILAPINLAAVVGMIVANFFLKVESISLGNRILSGVVYGLIIHLIVKIITVYSFTLVNHFLLPHFIFSLILVYFSFRYLHKNFPS